MADDWGLEKHDIAIADDLRGFLPDTLFDAHAHLYRKADLNLDQPSTWAEGPPDKTAEVWRESTGRPVGESRLAGGLFVPAPVAGCGLDRANRFVIDQAAKLEGSRALVLITPGTEPAGVAALGDEPVVAGLKPYHLFGTEQPTWESSIEGYLPEWGWELANENHWVILLHLVRTRALADPDNQHTIREMCRKYTNVKLILAHCGRGFHAPNTVKGIAALRGIENVWFDTAMICEAAPMLAVLREFGPRKLIWGSDWPLSMMRGRCATTGDGFVWLQPDTVLWDKLSPACNPTLVGLESLRALKDAADEFGLNTQDLQDIFRDNAQRLLGQAAEGEDATQSLYERAKKRIPGGVQLLSKRPEMMAPGQWPAYFREARGCEVWDLDGRHYYDVSRHAIGACLLGFRDPDVDRAVRRRVNLGSTSTQSSPDEVELADLLCEIHPWAEKVRFTRTGGEADAVAVRIARATTDRSVVAICGYHGWHDWYLAANLGEDDALRGHLLPGLDPLGVPRELRGTALTFTYNNTAEFDRILTEHGDRLAVVVMEPCRNRDPEPGFLEHVRDGAHSAGALLVFDEISIGWRLCLGGAHLRLGVNPDIAIFAKAMGNGYPIGAVIGTTEAMAGAHSSFISSTSWTEGIGCAAGLATVRKMMSVDVPAHVARVGELVTAGWRRHAERHGLQIAVGYGYPCTAGFQFEHDLANELRTLFTQLMLDRGFLATNGIHASLAHTDEVISLYDEAVDEVFREIAGAIAAGQVEARLNGPAAHTGFARLL